MVYKSWREIQGDIGRPPDRYRYHGLCWLVTVPHDAVKYIKPLKIKLEAAAVFTGQPSPFLTFASESSLLSFL